MKVSFIILAALLLMGCDKPIEYCTPDYCIQEGQTLEQIGINY